MWLIAVPILVVVTLDGRSRRSLQPFPKDFVVQFGRNAVFGGLKGAGDALFHNNGDGTFTDVSKAVGVDDPNGYYGMSVIFSDFNNAGRPDIYVANDSAAKFLYKNLGNGKFQEIVLESGTAVSEDGSEQASMGIAVGDYLHNGIPSLLVTNF